MKTVPLTFARKLITVLWFVGFALNFVLFLLQNWNGAYAGSNKDAWAWFLPTVIPSVSLIVGTIIYDSVKNTPGKTRVDRFPLWLTFSISLLYLLTLLATIGAAPNFNGGEKPLAFLQSSSVYLNPLQGLVGITLGAFFVARSKDDADSPSPR